MSDLVNLVRRNVFQSSFVHILIVSREAGQWTTSKSSQTVARSIREAHNGGSCFYFD